MALKKSELYSSLWQSCDALRGGMDASQYKDYVLVLLFIKYVSDKYAGKPYQPLTIPPGASFADMVALKGKSDIGDQINKKIIAPLVAANDRTLSQADFPDFNDAAKLGTGKEMVERLTELVAIFENKSLDFSKNRADGDDIRNVHLTVLPPNGRVRISAPRQMALDTVRVFALSKLAWIKSQRQSMAGQEREPPREYVERESHYVWGRRYLLKLVETDGAPTVMLRHRTLVLTVKQGAGLVAREAALSRWYRDQVRERAGSLVAAWSHTLGLDAPRVHVQHMKTKWGSCSPGRQSIRLNTELARKPATCLEYVVVHELMHLLEPTHNERFKALMWTFLPDWEDRRRELNALPIRHEDWDY